ncbi:hypothetical protein AB0B81_34775, partial [Streptomyces sp. NPDC039028]
RRGLRQRSADARRPEHPAVRRRLAQALADIPGDTASRALEALVRDEDRAVALTATYVRSLRERA